MTRCSRLEASKREVKIQEAVTDIKSKRHHSANQAAIELNMPHYLVFDRLDEIQSFNKAHQNP